MALFARAEAANSPAALQADLKEIVPRKAELVADRTGPQVEVGNLEEFGAEADLVLGHPG